jgi:hypothetical protein
MTEKFDGKWIEHIFDALKGLEYGSVQITIHDSQITQIDRLEKKRFPLGKKQQNYSLINKEVK